MAGLAPCVIYNPAAGRGRTRRAVEAIRRESPSAYDYRPTSGPGHAEELACAAARAGCPLVIAGGGDGTVHEVANGLLKAGTPEVVFSVWPFGSANDYAFTLGLSDWWYGDHARPKEVRAVDVGLAEGSDGRRRYFVNGMGVGFNGGVTVEARRVRWLRGLPLYAWALIRAMVRHFDKPRMSVALDELVRDVPTLALSVNLGRREGNFLITPRADPTDGLFDYLHAGPLPRWELLRFLPALATGNLPLTHPRVWQGRCRVAHVRSEAPLRIHLDGEFLCQPEDGLHEVTARLLPGALRVETFLPGR